MSWMMSNRCHIVTVFSPATSEKIIFTIFAEDFLSNDMKDDQAEDMKDDNDKEHSTVS